MIETQLQRNYVMDFLCRREDGLGYNEVKATAVNSQLFIPSDLQTFLETNAPKEWRGLLFKEYRGDEKACMKDIMAELLRRIRQRANVAVFFNTNKTFTFKGYNFNLLYVSETTLGGDNDFEKNIFSAVEEVPINLTVEGKKVFCIRPDISFFLNGIFLGYWELKCNWKGQDAYGKGRGKVVTDYIEAVMHYAEVAKGNDVVQTLRKELLGPLESSVHLTASDEEHTYVMRNIAQFTDGIRSDIDSEAFDFLLTKKKLIDEFKPYPLTNNRMGIKEKFEEVMRSLYAKKNIEKEILYYNFLKYIYKKDEKGQRVRTSNTGKLICPRPKQKFGTEKVINKIAEFMEHEQNPDYFINQLRDELEDAGLQAEKIEEIVNQRQQYRNNKYSYSLLLQYAAGFGKSNIIGWTALLLKDYQYNGEWAYDKIFIVVDRLQLRDQTDEMMYNMNIDNSMFVEATDKKTLLKAIRLKDKRRIIVVNIQKFFDLQEALQKAKQKIADMRVAFLIDEIHRSNTGEGHEQMINLFDKVADVVDKGAEHSQKKNLIVGYTATPSEEVLARFGEFHRGSNLNQIWLPFDAYTMQEAIDDGYVLDPSKSVIPVPAKMHFEDPAYPQGAGEDERYVIRKKTIYENEERMEAYADFIVNRLVTVVFGTIRGNGKAMLAVSSIPIAIRYYKLIKHRLQEKCKETKFSKYAEAVVSIVYSDSQEVPSSKMYNDNKPESQVIDEFKKAKNGLMIVVDKLQTGFDEPTLHTLFLDKEIKGINAIQTISRVNRTCKYKKDCCIIDLSFDNVNVKNIAEALSKYCDIVASTIEPMSIYSVLKQSYKGLVKETLYVKWFERYMASIPGTQENTDLCLEIEQDFKNWINQQEENNEKGATDNAKRLYGQVNEYLGNLDLLIGILDMEEKYSDGKLISFWSHFLNVYRTKHKGNETYHAVEVTYDDEIGIVANEPTPESIPSTRSGNGAGGVLSTYDIVKEIARMNDKEEEKGQLIEKWEHHLENCFAFVAANEEFMANYKNMEFFGRDNVIGKFQKYVRKEYIRKRLQDEEVKEFLKKHLDDLFWDFERYYKNTQQNIK